MRCIHCLLLLFFLSLCGCNTDKLRETPTAPEKPEDTDRLRVEGRVGPVWVENGLVSVHPITDQGLDLSFDIANTRTNESGKFDLTLDNRYRGEPVVFKIYVDPDVSRLRCYQLNGCAGDVAFGGTYIPEMPFEMFLAVPDLRSESYYSVTTLSHVAFKLIEAELLSPVSGENAVARTQKQYLIAQSNSRVANRIGVIGDLKSMAFIDVTNAAEVAAAREMQIKTSVMGLAIVQAAAKTYASPGIPDALQHFAEQYLQLGIPGVGDSASIVSHANVMREASTITSGLQNKHERDFSGFISELEAALGLTSLEEPGQYSRGTASDTSGLTAVEKAKSLVLDVRKVATSIDLRKIIALGSLSAMMDGGAADVLKQFGFELDSTEMFNDDHFDHVSSSIGFLIEAAFSSLVTYYSSEVIDTSYEGLSFTHVVAQDTHVFGVRSTYDVCDEPGLECPVTYNLDLTIRVVNFTGNSTTFAPEVLDFRLVGSVKSGDLQLSFLAPEQQIRFIRPIISAPDVSEEGWDGQLYRVAADALRIRLPFAMLKENTSVYETMNGMISVDVGKFQIEYNSREFLADEGESARSVINESEIKIERLEGLKVGFASAIKPGQGEEFLGSINIKQSSQPLIEPVLIKSNKVEYCPSANSFTCDEVSSETFIEGETAESFLGLHASMGFQAKLKGIAAPVVLELSGSRISPTASNINNLKIAYPGHAVNLTGRFNNNGGIIALDAVNLDGMHLYFDTINGKRTGAVETPDEEPVAEIIDMGQWVKVRYIDGYFESLL